MCVINVGAPACGVNSAIRSFVRHGVFKSCNVFAVLDGFEGLVKGQVIQIKIFTHFHTRSYYLVVFKRLNY